MLFQKLPQNTSYKIQSKQQTYFILNNIALDPQSFKASLYLITHDKKILITQFSRDYGGIKSVNLNLNLSLNQQIGLFAQEGSLHLIGSYQSYSKNQCHYNQKSKEKQKQKQIEKYIEKGKKQKQCHMIDQKQQKQQKKKNKLKNEKQQKQKPQNPQPPPPPHQQPPQPLRRSTRIKTSSKPLYSNKQKQQRRQKQQLKNMANYFNINENDLDDDQCQTFQKEQLDDQQDQDNQSQDDDYQKDKENSSDDRSSSSSKDQQQKEEIQIREKAKKGRKKRVTQKDSKDKIEDNYATQYSKHEDSPKQQYLNQQLHFSVPKRNPYT